MDNKAKDKKQSKVKRRKAKQNKAIQMVTIPLIVVDEELFGLRLANHHGINGLKVRRIGGKGKVHRTWHIISAVDNQFSSCS